MKKVYVKITINEAIRIIKDKLGVGDEVIHYLYNYKDGEELIKCIADNIK
ncbi:hypothetical protein HNQ56_002257 [Anaerotaenia torta]